MTSVLKAESTAGESYDSLYDGAKSLVNGLGSMLRVAARGARVYDSKLQGNFQIKASFVDAYERLSRKSRRVTFRSITSPFSWTRRIERDAKDAQLQVKNRSGKKKFKTYLNNRSEKMNIIKSEGYQTRYKSVVQLRCFPQQRTSFSQSLFSPFPSGVSSCGRMLLSMPLHKVLHFFLTVFFFFCQEGLTK